MTGACIALGSVVKCTMWQLLIAIVSGSVNTVASFLSLSAGSFEGLLFEGNTKDKSWTLVFQKHVAMTIRPPGGVAMGGAWGLVATQKDEPVSHWLTEIS